MFTGIILPLLLPLSPSCGGSIPSFNSPLFSIKNHLVLKACESTDFGAFFPEKTGLYPLIFAHFIEHCGQRFCAELLPGFYTLKRCFVMWEALNILEKNQPTSRNLPPQKNNDCENDFTTRRRKICYCFD
jgi:hypothetical protein